MALSIPEQGEAMEASLLSILRSAASAFSISSSLPDMAEEHLSSAAATAVAEHKYQMSSKSQSTHTESAYVLEVLVVYQRTMSSIHILRRSA